MGLREKERLIKMMITTGNIMAPSLTGVILSTYCLTVGVVKNLNDAKKFKEENERLRNELKKANLGNKTKQEVIKRLNEQLEQVKVELKVEKEKLKRNEERIKLMEEQITDLMETIKIAYDA